MGIGIALLLAAAAPAGLPAQAVVVPIAADPIISRARLHRPAIRVARYDMPLPPLDLRRIRTSFAAPATDGRGFESGITGTARAVEADDYRVDANATNLREAAVTGRRLRRSRMAAGLSLRMTNADGVLASQLGMSGSVGRALNRIASEVIE